jgi:hypothetical protein
MLWMVQRMSGMCMSSIDLNQALSIAIEVTTAFLFYLLFVFMYFLLYIFYFFI